jgi:thymidine kinase
MSFNIYTSSNKKTMTNNSTHSNQFTSYLELFIGPMFSGKTSKLVEIYKQCLFCNIPVAVINHSIDIRYHNNLLSTHDKIMIPCIQTNKLKDIWQYDKTINNSNSILQRMDDSLKLINADVIIINEGQFFDDLLPAVEHMLQDNKKIYVGGLDGDFERKKFGQILDLIPLCDKVTKMTSLCGICKNGTPGIFSKRISLEKEQTVVGSDNYIPVCRPCYSFN